MDSFTANDAKAAIAHLHSHAVGRNDILNTFNEVPNVSSDEDANSSCPYFDIFHNNFGSSYIVNVTNIDAAWNNLECYPRKSTLFQSTMSVVVNTVKFLQKNALFMALMILKHGRNWDMPDRVFKMKRPKFKRIVSQFSSFIVTQVLELFVNTYCKIYTIQNLCDSHQILTSVWQERYTVDVTF